MLGNNSNRLTWLTKYTRIRFHGYDRDMVARNRTPSFSTITVFWETDIFHKIIRFIYLYFDRQNNYS